MSSNRLPKTTFVTVPVVPGVVRREPFTNAKALRVVQGQYLRAWVGTGDSPADGVRGGVPLSSGSALQLDASEAWFDFRELDAAETYDPLVVELYVGRGAVYAPCSPEFDIIGRDVVQLDALAMIANARVELFNNTDSEWAAFNLGRNSAAGEQYLSGIVSGTAAFELSLRSSSGGFFHEIGYANAPVDNHASGDVTNRFFVHLDTMLYQRGGADIIYQGTLGATVSNATMTHKRPTLPRGSVSSLHVVNGGGANTIHARIAVLSR